MTKRLLDANASDFATMTSRQLLQAIRLSEGRVIAAEVIAVAPPLVDKVSNGELASAMGADLILLNLYDVTNPQITGLPSEGESDTNHFGHFPQGKGRTIADLKQMIGRAVGLNLEPIEKPEAITTCGRLATPENARLAVEQGADLFGHHRQSEDGSHHTRHRPQRADHSGSYRQESHPPCRQVARRWICREGRLRGKRAGFR